MKDEIEYVKKSKYRMRVMKTLDGYPKMPFEIAKESEMTPNHISHTLKQLKEHGLVECLNPEARKGKLYRLTDKGKKVIENF